MRQGEFISALGGSLVAWPLIARAQQGSNRWLIGVLSPISEDAAFRNVGALRTGLRDLGYFEGRNIKFEIKATERLPQLATELVKLNPDVRIAASGTVFRSLNGSIRACAFNAVLETHGFDSSQRLASWFSLDKEIAGPSATADIERVDSWSAGCPQSDDSAGSAPGEGSLHCVVHRTEIPGKTCYIRHPVPSSVMRGRSLSAQLSIDG
jgi:hypothetical protein